MALKHIVYIFLMLALPLASLAGNKDKTKAAVKTVVGKITTVTGEEIAGVKLTVKETNETVYADLDGNFKLQLKTDKVYSISVEGIGYAPLEVKSTDLGLFSDLSLKEL